MFAGSPDPQKFCWSWLDASVSGLMGQVNIRYFGVTLGDSRGEERPDPRLGRFFATADPMPVGTSLEVDGVVHVVSRVEEGTRSGVWLWAEGVGTTASAPSGTPLAVDDVPTAPMTPEPPVAEALAPPAEALPQPDAPSLSVDDSSGKTEDPKRKRRRSKTVVGR